MHDVCQGCNAMPISVHGDSDCGPKPNSFFSIRDVMMEEIAATSGFFFFSSLPKAKNCDLLKEVDKKDSMRWYRRP